MTLGDARLGDAKQYGVTLPCPDGEYESVKAQAAAALLNHRLDAGEFPAATMPMEDVSAQYGIRCEVGPLGQLPDGRVCVAYDALNDQTILRADCMVRSIW